MKKVLLHICCAGCASASIERLRNDGYWVEGFFYNPNIHPLAEYKRRKDDLLLIEKAFGISINIGEYNPKEWFALCGKYKDEPEGGYRCSLCYKLRLMRTYREAKERGFDFFTTTLTISPHKKSFFINRLGKEIGTDSYLEYDFKKKEGFKRSIEISRNLGLYRQNYCGCVFSLKERLRKNR